MICLYPAFVRCFVRRCVLALLLLAASALPAVAQVDFAADRAIPHYEVGEAMNFVIDSASSGSATWTIRWDVRSQTQLASGVTEVTGGTPAMVSFTAAEPGVVVAEVALNGQTVRAAATFSVRAIEPFEDEPADFDAFWAAQVASLPADLGVALGEADTGDPDVDHWSFNALTVAAGGGESERRVYGHVTQPKTGPGPFPAILKLPAYGSSGEAGEQADMARRTGAIVVDITIHNGNPNGGNPYEPNDVTDPNGYYYRWAILAAVRAIDYIETLDAWNGHLSVTGESQGGGLSTIVAGLDDRVEAMAISNPALAENAGLAHNEHSSGFPWYVHKARQESLDVPTVVSAARYYDAINFAKRFDGPSYHVISYEDDICPPATTFSLFNRLRGERILVHARELGHSHPWPEFFQDRYPFFRRHMPGTPVSWVVPTTGYAIDAGAAQQIAEGASANLVASTEFDGTSNSSWPVTWKKISGPGDVVWSAPTSRATEVSFTEAGEYVLEIEALDDEKLEDKDIWITLHDTVTVIVGEGDPRTPIFEAHFETHNTSEWDHNVP